MELQEGKLAGSVKGRRWSTGQVKFNFALKSPGNTEDCKQKGDGSDSVPVKPTDTTYTGHKQITKRYNTYRT